MIVADASALVIAAGEIGEGQKYALHQLTSHAVHCPGHVDAEVGQAFRRLARLPEVSVKHAEQAMLDSLSLINHRHHLPEAAHAIAWALRDNLSYYDALYVALAIVLDVPLLTGDARLARSNPPCAVDLIP
jgi:predicted nucleic acid-binding protein